jgi:anti-sigma B factor antagonist
MSSTDPAGMRVQEIAEGGVHTVILSGELDLATRPLLDAALARVEHEPIDALVLDLGALGFMDSTGLHGVLTAKAMCARNGCDFMVLPGSTQVQRLFALSGVLDELSLREDVVTA